MAVFYKLSKCKIEGNKSENKWFGHLASLGKISYRELCKHISDHNSPYGYDTIMAVALKLQECILEKLNEGYKVEFGELGTFYYQLKSKPSDDVTSFSAQEHIGNIYLRFSPRKDSITDLSSKTLRKKTQLRDINSLTAEEAYETLKTENQNAQEGDGL